MYLSNKDLELVLEFIDNLFISLLLGFQMGQVHAKEAVNEASDQIPLDNIKAKVVSVSVDGVVRTKDDLIMDTVKDLFQVKIWIVEDNVMKGKKMEKASV